MIKKTLIISIVILSLFTAANLFAQTEEKESAPSKELITLLDKIETTGAKLKSVQADMLFKQEQLLVETITTRSGALYYQTSGKTVKARIHFDDFIQQDIDDEEKGKPVVFNEDYAFDGLWVTRRNERTKSIQRWEVSKTPDNKESFRLGKGPFPLPFAIKKSDVLDQFKVTITKPAKDDPKGTTHLNLIPKKKSSYAKEYLQLNLWISNKNYLPIQISYLKENYETTTVTWSKLQLDKKLNDKVFQLDPPGKGWTEEVTPLEDPKENKNTPEKK